MLEKEGYSYLEFKKKKYYVYFCIIHMYIEFDNKEII